MLIIRWNEASLALPVLTLKSNYLDRWPNDCYFDFCSSCAESTIPQITDVT